VDNSFSHDRCSDTVIRKFAGESLDALNRLNKVSLQGRRYDMPQPMAVRRWQNSGGSTSARGRVRSARISCGLRWLSCRQPACL